ncbi:MAG: heat-inducible transcriptional repressor HrcA [Alphaproteobacteria bacterium]
MTDMAISQLSKRSREIFRQIVDAYVATGEPVGSRTLSRRSDLALSPATIRNVMADLEEAGLLYSPHTSAGRLPTDTGMQLFVHGLLEVGRLSEEERASIEGQCAAAGHSVEKILEEATTLISGLSSCAGVVIAPKTEAPLKQIEFLNLGPGQALVVLVFEGGLVENRVVELPIGTPPSALVEATNYLSARMIGRTMGEVRADILTELETHRAELGELTERVVAEGLAMWAGTETEGSLIVRGQSKLLDDVSAIEDLEKVRVLFEMLETKEGFLRLLESTHDADGVQIFIGSENQLFSHAGCSMIIAPYADSRENIVGAIGVVGPTRMNYARIIPLVDYTAQVIGRLIG